MSDEKKSRGGKREGSGRPSTGLKRVSFCVSCQPEELAAIKEKAKQAGKTVSSFLLDLAFQR